MEDRWSVGSGLVHSTFKDAKGYVEVWRNSWLNIFCKRYQSHPSSLGTHGHSNWWIHLWICQDKYGFFLLSDKMTSILIPLFALDAPSHQQSLQHEVAQCMIILLHENHPSSLSFSLCHICFLLLNSWQWSLSVMNSLHSSRSSFPLVLWKQRMMAMRRFS